MTWLPIEGYEGYYEVSDNGEIRSLTRTVSHSVKGSHLVHGKPIKQFLNHQGYPQVILRKNGKFKLMRVNRLVAHTFIDKRNSGLEVNHKNGIKTDNRVENLECVTRSENQLHAYRCGLQKPIRGEKHHWCKLTDEQVDYIKLHYTPRHPEFSQSALAKKFKIDQSTVSYIVNGKRRLNGG